MVSTVDETTPFFDRVIPASTAALGRGIGRPRLANS
jgi:hypothetical protein